MDAVRLWRAPSNPLRLLLFHSASFCAAASRTARGTRTTRVRCCSSQVAAPAPAASAAPDRRRGRISSTSDKESIRVMRLKKVEELRSKGYEPYAYNWDRSHTTKQIQELYKHLQNGEECKEILVSISGRIVARRQFGKLAFLTLRDDSGTIQQKDKQDDAKKVKEILRETLGGCSKLSPLTGRQQQKMEMRCVVAVSSILSKFKERSPKEEMRLSAQTGGAKPLR
ncbi:hypothetical protein Taro_016297 [Colocasia esculenta]|uniref:OB domain-containing protein n=1 Tax=Colocasia esculenta TaxID=4460 RepID=A0A843UN64_COLES|nr:hypothetical protein [Colocasia esculenta]